MMHGGRDITARKSLEWGDIEIDKDGNRTIRYMFEATLPDEKAVIANQLFTFDAKGNILKTQDLPGYPKKAMTQARMKELVNDFLAQNFRDVASCEAIQWGNVAKTAEGNFSIRYKYRLSIHYKGRDKPWSDSVTIMNQVFTFDPKGQFVSIEETAKKYDDNGSNPGRNPSSTPANADSPASAVTEFLDAIRTGNDVAASRMLTSVARQKMGRLNRSLTPPASDTAKFTVGKVEQQADGARVAATWTDVGPDGHPKTDEAVWVLRQEPDGWRIAGVAAQVFPDKPPVLLNFEDPDDMHRKQSQVRDELQKQLQPKNTP
jgi:hypothetical protein